MALNTNMYCRSDRVDGHLITACIRQDYMNVYASAAGELATNEVQVQFTLQGYTGSGWETIDYINYGLLQDGQDVNVTFTNIAVRDRAIRVRVHIGVYGGYEYVYSPQIWR